MSETVIVHSGQNNWGAIGRPFSTDHTPNQILHAFGGCEIGDMTVRQLVELGALPKDPVTLFTYIGDLFYRDMSPEHQQLHNELTGSRHPANYLPREYVAAPAVVPAIQLVPEQPAIAQVPELVVATLTDEHSLAA